MAHIVVVGAGQAGASLVAKLRGLGFDGQLTLIGAEPVPPYQRPPLSKKYLLGEMEVERLYLRPESFYAEQAISLNLGTSVRAIDPASKMLQIGTRSIDYDQLALTTGSIPRRLPQAIGGELAGVHVVRTLADVDGMASEFRPARKVLIVGGGYIGLEAAAVAASKGLEVTLIEAAARILQRVASPETSEYFRNLHESHGVTICEGAGLERFLGEGRVTGARLLDGREIAADFAIVGVGITPDIGLAEAAGLAIENGVRVDAQGRTSDASIWAAGDCASFPYHGRHIRLESVQNAIDQAECVAENMLGAGREYSPVPWFWSDQYETKLQIAGLNTGYDHIVTRPGDGDGTVSYWYFKGDTLLAVDAMNDSRAYMVGKRLLEMGRSVERLVIADPASNLKGLLK